jgi:glutamate-ammonia-ligase adenylyltransferase
LNYSSDVDVIFVYSEEGHVFKERPDRTTKAPARGLTSHEYFKRLAEMFIAEVSRSTGDGMLFRIDLRLRPEGDQGPLARSLASYETYYAQWGQTWERMMLLKARGVAGDAELAAEFIEMIHPFRHPRSLNEGVLREIAAMKDRIEQEIVRAGDLERNVKLGRGGIREIEFVAQSLQLIHAGRIPFLQGAQTLPTLQKLVQYGLLEVEAERHLAAAYTFLRDVEHRLQMENNLQTHTLPREVAEMQRLAVLMGFRTRSGFEKSLREHQGRVRGVYEGLFHREEEGGKPDLPDTFAGAEVRWKEVLAGHGFRDLDRSYRLLHEFAHGPGYVHVSPRTTELAAQLIPRLLALCPNPAREPNPEPETRNRILSDPDRVLARLDSYITAYGARATMFATWAANPQLFELLLLLFDRSEFLAERAIRTPDLVDDLVLSGRLNRQKSAEEILRDLEHGHDDPDQHVWLRRYFQAEQMRLGLRDILGLAEFDQNLAELSALADACLRYALAVVLRKHRCRTLPLAVIGLGKLGGAEVTYGSDLDVLFVARAGARDLPRWQRIAADVMDLLSRRTGDGLVFVTDARLRPDGEKGLLVNTLDAFEEYYRRRAALWEIQALTRTRFVAGDPGVGHQFQELAGALTNFRPNAVAAGFPWRRSGAGRRTRSVPDPRPDRAGGVVARLAGENRAHAAADRGRAHARRTGGTRDQDRGGRIDRCGIHRANPLPRARLAGGEHAARPGTRPGRRRTPACGGRSAS